MRTKKEIRAAIDELRMLPVVGSEGFANHLAGRIAALNREMESASEDFTDNILRSHRTLCEIKNMGLKDAYGQDPIMYYTLGMLGEAGEIANKIVKGHRNGYSFKNAQEAVCSELPDVFIYGTILGYVAEIDVHDEINKKVEIVIERALDGYYGSPFKV